MAARNHGKPWTAPEIAELRKSYRKVLHRELAARLGRTLSSVESKATELGLTHDRPKGHPAENRGVYDRGGKKK